MSGAVSLPSCASHKLLVVEVYLLTVLVFQQIYLIYKQMLGHRAAHSGSFCTSWGGPPFFCLSPQCTRALVSFSNASEAAQSWSGTKESTPRTRSRRRSSSWTCRRPAGWAWKPSPSPPPIFSLTTSRLVRMSPPLWSRRGSSFPGLSAALLLSFFR